MKLGQETVCLYMSCMAINRQRRVSVCCCEIGQIEKRRNLLHVRRRRKGEGNAIERYDRSTHEQRTHALTRSTASRNRLSVYGCPPCLDPGSSSPIARPGSMRRPNRHPYALDQAWIAPTKSCRPPQGRLGAPQHRPTPGFNRGG